MKDKAKAVKEKTTTKKITQQESLSSRIMSEENGRDILKIYLDDQAREIFSLKENMEVQKHQMDFFYNAIANLYNETRMPLNETKDWMKRTDDMIGEFSKSQNAQGNLLNQRIDRVYSDVQTLIDLKGLDLDMKKIVDGLEETVHELELKCKSRYDIAEARVESYKHLMKLHFVNIWDDMDEIKKTRKLIEWLVIYGFTMALVAFAWTIVSVIKQMFF